MGKVVAPGPKITPAGRRNAARATAIGQSAVRHVRKRKDVVLTPPPDTTECVVPAAIKKQLSDGIPQNLFGARYVAVDKADWMSTPDRGLVLRFGESEEDCSMCVDPETGEVVEAINPAAVWSATSGAAAPRSCLFVNSSLALFSETVHAVSAGYPYYPPSSSHEEWAAAGKIVADMIAHIDPPSMARDLFWSTLTDDIAMGDFDGCH